MIAEQVEAARKGDIEACAALVRATQAMAYAVAWRILRDEAEARDAVQDAYMTAFKRLAELLDAAAFPGWLRRIVVTGALNRRRRARQAWVVSEEAAPPVLDAGEERWSEEQQRLLARALLGLNDDERRLCELHYHGGMNAERLAALEGVDAAAVRKRLQRVRDKLRKEIEMEEQRDVKVPDGLPATIIELLARPRLVDLPENPVGATVSSMRSAFSGFTAIDLPEESIDVQRDGHWYEVMAWGEYADWVMRALGADPSRQIALGAGFGLERLATLRYGIDDIRKVASTRIAS